jgi:uncharacterized protein (UPF0548 family)
MRIAWRPDPNSLHRALAEAEAAELTYTESTGSDAEVLPSGYAHLFESTPVGSGRPAFERLAGALLAWDLHRAARMVLATSTPSVEPGCTVVNAAPIGPLALLAPCRVVARIDEQDRRGFAYGTLPGHPLVGEERFTVEIDADERVHLRIRSFSRPVGLARTCPPIARAGQRMVNRRYAEAARRLAG